MTQAWKRRDVGSIAGAMLKAKVRLPKIVALGAQEATRIGRFLSAAVVLTPGALVLLAAPGTAQVEPSILLSWSDTEIVTNVDRFPSPPILYLWLSDIDENPERVAFHLDHTVFSDDPQAFGIQEADAAAHGVARVANIAPGHRTWGPLASSLVLERSTLQSLERIAVGVHPPMRSRPASFVVSYFAYLDSARVLRQANVELAKATFLGGTSQAPRAFVHTVEPVSGQAGSILDVTLTGNHLGAVRRVVLAPPDADPIEAQVVTRDARHLAVTVPVPSSVVGSCAIDVEPNSHPVRQRLQLYAAGSPSWPLGTTVWEATGSDVLLSLLPPHARFPFSHYVVEENAFLVEGSGQILRPLPRFPPGTTHRAEVVKVAGERHMIRRYDHVYLVSTDGESIEWHKEVQPGRMCVSPDGRRVVVSGGHGGHGIPVSDGVRLINVDGSERTLPVGFVAASAFLDDSRMASAIVDDPINVGRNPCPVHLVCHDLEGRTLWTSDIGDYVKFGQLSVNGDVILIIYEDWSENRGHETGSWEGPVPYGMKAYDVSGHQVFTQTLVSDVKRVVATVCSERRKLIYATKALAGTDVCYELDVLDMLSGATEWRSSLGCHPRNVKGSLGAVAYDSLSGRLAVTISHRSEPGRLVDTFVFTEFGEQLLHDRSLGTVRDLAFVGSRRYLYLSPPGRLVVVR